MRLVKFVITLATIAAAAPALAQTPAFDPRSWKGAHAGPPTQVLTIGSAHLSELKTKVTPAMFDPLIAKLAVFNPTIITHEGLSGEQCQQVRTYKKRYPSIWSDYCRGTEEAEMATGLNVAEAMAAIETTLSAWPAKPTAAHRRKLAATFLAAGDRPSAQVQWLQLSQSERKAGDGIDTALLKILAREGATPNETFEVAVRLAAQLGLQRVYAVDDHTSDSIQYLAAEGYEAALQKHWNASRDDPTGKEYLAKMDLMVTADGVLDGYRFLNAPKTLRNFVSIDFGAALKLETPQLFGRQYVAWYETRNLRMVANIRAAFGNAPGARVLNIVGASHKAYYDAYLDMMHEVKLVDAETILR